jgi:hypothetical protein
VWEIQARIALNCQKVRTQPKGSLLAEWRSRCGRTCCFVGCPTARPPEHSPRAEERQVTRWECEA